MKILSYSDLHLEFRNGWSLPDGLEGDILILAGDIILFNDFPPLFRLLRKWSKPVLYVAGNHEYYCGDPMRKLDRTFKNLLANELAQVHFLNNEAVTIGGVNFFGGTMWTDFNAGDEKAMRDAEHGMNDFSRICKDITHLTPEESINFHKEFKSALKSWLKLPLTGPRVVVTHHAPVVNPKTQYQDSMLQPAFNATDMQDLIKKYQPDVWIYGHTHECDNQSIGKTRIISNQLGYLHWSGYYECNDLFDERGCSLTLL
jgi:Icc-related predicted phosphoesterase